MSHTARPSLHCTTCQYYSVHRAVTQVCRLSVTEMLGTNYAMLYPCNVLWCTLPHCTKFFALHHRLNGYMFTIFNRPGVTGVAIKGANPSSFSFWEKIIYLDNISKTLFYPNYTAHREARFPGGDKQQTEIATSILNWPRGWFSEKKIFFGLNTRIAIYEN